MCRCCCPTTTDSRGETFGGLLDCMANGLPTIVNAHGSFIDYNDGEYG